MSAGQATTHFTDSLARLREFLGAASDAPTRFSIVSALVFAQTCELLD